MLALAALIYLVLRHTRFGLHVYAVGGDLNVARLSGIRTTPTILAVYATTDPLN